MKIRHWKKTKHHHFWQITNWKKSKTGHIKCYISIKLKPSLSLISWKCLGTTYTIKGKLDTRIEMVHFEKCQNKTFECFFGYLFAFSKDNHWAKWSEIHCTFHCDGIHIFHQKKRGFRKRKQVLFQMQPVQLGGWNRPQISSFRPVQRVFWVWGQTGMCPGDDGAPRVHPWPLLWILPSVLLLDFILLFFTFSASTTKNIYISLFCRVFWTADEKHDC